MAGYRSPHIGNAPGPSVATVRATKVEIVELYGVLMAEIEGVERLRRYPFHPAALGELEFRVGRVDVAGKDSLEAILLARNEGEREFLSQRVVDCGPGPKSTT